MNENLFPTFSSFVLGKNRNKLQEKYEFDMKKFENTLTNMHIVS